MKKRKQVQHNPLDPLVNAARIAMIALLKAKGWRVAASGLCCSIEARPPLKYNYRFVMDFTRSKIDGNATWETNDEHHIERLEAELAVQPCGGCE